MTHRPVYVSDLKFIPVKDAGRTRDVTIDELLTKANELSFDTTDPVRLAPIMGDFIVPIVVGVLGRLPFDSHEVAELLAKGRFDVDAVQQHLESIRDRLNLFDDVHPFGQTADLQTLTGKVLPAQKLFPQSTSGNSVPFTATERDDEALPIGFEDAVVGMFLTQSYAPAGLLPGARGDGTVNGGTSKGNRVGKLGELGLTVGIGKNVYDTIILNLPPVARQAQGMPTFLREPPTAAWSNRSVSTVLDNLTFQPRRIRLIATEDGTAIESVVITAGDRTDSPLSVVEPRTPWRMPKGPGVQNLRPAKFRSTRAFWEELPSLLNVGSVNSAAQSNGARTTGQIEVLRELFQLDALPADYPLNFITVAIDYGTQNAIITDMRSGSLPLPVLALDRDSLVYSVIETALAAADDLRSALNQLDYNIRRVASADGTKPWDKGSHPGDLAMADIGQLFEHLLLTLRSTSDEDAEQVLAFWLAHAARIIRSHGESYLQSVSPSTLRKSATLDKGGDMTVGRAEILFQAAVTKATKFDAVDA